MEDFVLSQEWITVAAATFLSLLFSYVPKVEEWYGTLAPKVKALIMLGSLLLVSIGIVAVSCANLYLLVECTQGGILGVAEVFIDALIVNQVVFVATKKIPLWKKPKKASA